MIETHDETGVRVDGCAAFASRREAWAGFHGAAACLAALALVLGSTESRAQAVVSASPDVTIALGPASLVTGDHAVAVDNQQGVVVLQSLGTLPDAVDVIGYAETGSTTRLFTVDTTALLTGGVLARPGDVVSWNGSVHAIVFDAEAAGLPRGLAIDAVSAGYDGGLLLSFETDVSLPGSLHVADEDLVRWDGSAFSLALDGSSAGMGRAFDVDGVDDLGPSSFLVSFDTSGSVGGVSFADEDVLRLQGGAWSLEVDLSAVDADWEAADLDALQVPEPAIGAGVGAGFLCLTSLCALRGRSSVRGARDRRIGTIPLPCALLALLALAGIAALPARAEEGIREIDQTCATTGGCGPGDAAGFPVTITTSGSYRLTSNLTLPNELLDAIFISASGVRIDLDGFAIVGPVVCSGTLISCTPAGTGTGVEASSTRNDVRVENGSITGMGTGISLPGAGIHVARVRVSSNRLTGISVGSAARISESIVFRNGGVGIAVGRGSSVTRSAISRNGLTGLSLFATVATGGLVASENSIHDNQGSGIAAYFGSSVFTRNTVFSNGIHGISANGGAQVSANTVTFNGDNGLDLGLSDSGYTENVVAGNGTDAVGGLGLAGNSCGGTVTCP